MIEICKFIDNAAQTLKNSILDEYQYSRVPIFLHHHVNFLGHLAHLSKTAWRFRQHQFTKLPFVSFSISLLYTSYLQTHEVSCM